MRSKLNRLWATNCKHERTIVVRSTGMERIVCESCGHISFAFDGAGPYPLDPDQGSRDLAQSIEV